MRFTAFDRYYPITWAPSCRVVRIRNRCCPDTGQLLLLLFGWTNLSIINYKFALCQKSITDGSRIKGYKHATATQTADKLLFLCSVPSCGWMAAVKDLKQWFEAFFRSDCCWMMGGWSWFLKNGLLCYVYPIRILRGIMCNKQSLCAENHKIFMELSRMRIQGTRWLRRGSVSDIRKSPINFDSANDLWSDCKMKNGGRP